jgi:hypothetical protein
MKLKKEHILLFAGTFISFFIIYLTKINKTPAAADWIYEIGQFLWFNLAITYLGSVIFYLIVVFIPEQRKRRHFRYQMGIDIHSIYLKGLGLFFYLRNASNIQSEIPDTGNISLEDVEKMISKVDLNTTHTFINEPGRPTQTFKVYLEIYKSRMNESINNALVIPYDDEELSLVLIQLQRTPILTGQLFEKNESKIDQMGILIYFTQLKRLEYYWEKHFKPFIYGQKCQKKIS